MRIFGAANEIQKIKMKNKKIKVYMIESERGWGQRIDGMKEFDTQEEAEKFVLEYNTKHNPPGSTPDWYLYAQLATDNCPFVRREK